MRLNEAFKSDIISKFFSLSQKYAKEDKKNRHWEIYFIGKNKDDKIYLIRGIDSDGDFIHSKNKFPIGTIEDSDLFGNGLYSDNELNKVQIRKSIVLRVLLSIIR